MWDDVHACVRAVETAGGTFNEGDDQDKEDVRNRVTQDKEDEEERQGSANRGGNG